VPDYRFIEKLPNGIKPKALRDSGRRGSECTEEVGFGQLIDGESSSKQGIIGKVSVLTPRGQTLCTLKPIVRRSGVCLRLDVRRQPL
jgi:hypothetical protein